ncbi:hypothetical protein G1K75_12820 [Tenacibaculum finnmarkense]|uniref:DUF6624 domain-containing protein n=1 Tax=Tenacibaculum finnmarkense TaxID=2781243 RepID=UPI00187B53DF|nr:DUF6624 domain-containing protein [Tenacibaculum finnmarkense]MBE7693696.1 hypothetical protein [Tenacibaculum finnmarkense genomovar finnmarkense]MCG8806532.1 hypothetical protein [Tenacibaculum finnmarkense]MCG8857681.1 hypothetical protein [Tenacibaculum finnmarkense]
MRNIFILVLLIIMFSSCKNGENKEENIVEKIPTTEERAKYTELKSEAWNLYENQEYLKSAKKYSEAFTTLGNKGNTNDRYNAACSWALANQIDSSFVQLFRISEKGNYLNYGHITTDTDLTALHSDERWNKVLNLVKANKEKAEANLDKPLVTILDTIYQEDQGLRRQISEVEKKFGRDSEEMKTHWKTINEKDSINLIKIQKILDEKGWLGQDVIGGQGNSTLFLVIQHSPLEIQQKYLPMMRQAVKNNNARPSSLALLEDRVALRTGNRQIYGSQIGRNQETGKFYVSPIKDPESVDKRRTEVGLGTIQEYINNWNIIWNVEKHKEMTTKLEAEKK